MFILLNHYTCCRFLVTVRLSFPMCDFVSAAARSFLKVWAGWVYVPIENFNDLDSLYDTIFCIFSTSSIQRTREKFLKSVYFFHGFSRFTSTCTTDGMHLKHMFH